jgi:hypothetical protein
LKDKNNRANDIGKSWSTGRIYIGKFKNNFFDEGRLYEL